MKNEKGHSHNQKKSGLYGMPFQASTWAVEIHELPFSSSLLKRMTANHDRFQWIAKYNNVEMSASHPVDSEEPFKTAREAENDFLLLMKAQCICVCSMKIIHAKQL
jgi:hypothetical protein